MSTLEPSLETKRRLLLSKYLGTRAELIRLRAEVEELEEARDDAWKDVESLQNERNALQSQLDDMCSPDAFEVLETVRYWLLDGLAHHRLVSDPRALLRKVEGVLS